MPTTADDYGPDLFADFIVDFIGRNKHQPFFVYYPMVLTHSPWVTTPEAPGTAAQMTKHSKGNLQANVETMDRIVGRIVDRLDELGLCENTVLFFTGDNGTGNNGKSLPTEMGARVPMIVNGPGIVETRGSTLELTDLSDVLPTIVEFAKAKFPTDRPIDGHSLVDFLKGDSDTTRDWIFAYQADRRILRTKRWLLEDNSPLHRGQLYDCGDSRDGTGYVEKTGSDDPEARATKHRTDQQMG